MAERKHLIYAPGNTQGYYVDSRHYTGSHNRLLYVFRNAGFEPHFFQPDWRCPEPRTWASNMAEYADNVVREKDEAMVLAGFSLGGVVTALAAAELQQSSEVSVDGLAAFSFSPVFGSELVQACHILAQDIHSNSETLKAAFCELEVPKIECPVQLYVGQDELGIMREFHEDVLAQWPQAQSIKPPCKHNVFAEPYLNAISHNIGQLAMTSTPSATY